VSLPEASPGPVRWLPTDERSEPTDGVGLCLSGGGYRAMLYHLGSLWRLSDAGLLARLDRISSVSGGSITAGVLGQSWGELGFDERGVAEGFEERVVRPVRELASRTVDEGAIALGILTPDTIGERVAAALQKHLFGERTLQDLPDSPRFVINATNLASGVLWRFSKPYMADYRVGTIRSPSAALAAAVAASAAFPPVLSPFVLELEDPPWETVEGNELTGPEYRDRVVLADGGVYDNLGLETVWKRCLTVLVSDGGGRLADDPDPPADWPRQSIRVLKVIDNQVRDLRKRQIHDAYGSGARLGAYWGIRSEIDDFGCPDPLPCPADRTLALAELPTRLRALDDSLQERLINWGFAACDAAIRTRLAQDLAAPSGFPYPGAGLG
jgi:NTE family protein